MPKIKERIKSAFQYFNISGNGSSSSTPSRAHPRKPLGILDISEISAPNLSTATASVGDESIVVLSDPAKENTPATLPPMTMKPISLKPSKLDDEPEVMKIKKENTTGYLLEEGELNSIIIIDDFKFQPNPKRQEMMEKSFTEEHRQAGIKSPSRVAVGIFYDIENIPIPSCVTPAEFINKIRKQFAEGPGLWEKTFSVVTWFRYVPHKLEKQMWEYNLDLINIPRHKPDAADNKLRQLMVNFVDAHKFSRIVLISGDSDFSMDIRGFRGRGTEVIVVHNSQAKGSLLDAASEAHSVDKVFESEIKKKKQDEDQGQMMGPLKRAFTATKRVFTEKPQPRENQNKLRIQIPGQRSGNHHLQIPNQPAHHLAQYNSGYDSRHQQSGYSRNHKTSTSSNYDNLMSGFDKYRGGSRKSPYDRLGSRQ